MRTKAKTKTNITITIIRADKVNDHMNSQEMKGTAQFSTQTNLKESPTKEEKKRVKLHTTL